MSSVLRSVNQENTDLQTPGARADAEHGLGASYYYEGNKKALTPQVIANKFSTLWTYADNYRKTFLPEILEAYMQYNGETESRAKEPWQSDINVPLPAQAVDVAAGRITKAIFESENFFEVDPDRSADTLITEFAKRATKWQIKRGDGLEEIKTAMKNALICGFGPLKVHYQAETKPFTEVTYQPSPLALGGAIIADEGEAKLRVTERLIKRIRFEAPIPTDVWLDPSGKHRWLIQRTTRYPSDLWPLTEDLRDATGAVVRRRVYDPREVARVRAGMRSSMHQTDAARIRRDYGTAYGTAGYDNTCDVFEFWGDFPDPDNGAVLFKNCVLTVVDKRITIRMPQSNPLWHCQPPYVIFTSKLLPHQVYGYGILKQPARIQKAINRQANVISDKNMLQVPTLEFDASASKDPDMQNNGTPRFAPGKMWPRKPGPPEKKIFYPVEGFQPVQPMDLAWMDRLTNWYQLASTVPEFASGAQMSNNRKTAQEANIRANAAQENFNDAATHIESRCMGPLLKLVYLTMVQYEDQYDDPELERMFGADDQDSAAMLQELKRMSPAERWEALYLDSEFKSVGITNEITRQQQIQELSDFQRLTSADPLLSMFIDKRQQLRGMLQLFHQPQRMVLPQGMAMMQALQAAQLAQIMGPMPMGPGGAPGGGGFGGKNPPGNPHNSLASVAGEAGRTE